MEKAPWIVKAFGNVYRVVNLENGAELGKRPVFQDRGKVGEHILFETTSYAQAEAECHTANSFVELFRLRYEGSK